MRIVRLKAHDELRKRQTDGGAHGFEFQKVQPPFSGLVLRYQ